MSNRHLLSREDIRAVLQRLDGDGFLAAALAYGSGLHLSEIAELRAADLDFQHHLILIHSGSDGERILIRETCMPRCIVPELVVQTRAALRLKTAVNPNLLADELRLFEGDIKRLQRPVAQAAREAGAVGLSLRRLRTAFISDLLSLGNNDQTVLRWSGLPQPLQLNPFPIRRGLPHAPLTSLLDHLGISTVNLSLHQRSFSHRASKGQAAAFVVSLNGC